MREIKFRAWIPDIERMYQVMQIDVEPQNGRQKWCLVWEHPCVKSAMIKGKVGKFRIGDGVEIMQYTGLKDKNGVEVYEGDIIALEYNKDLIGEVFWHNKDMSFYQRNKKWGEGIMNYRDLFGLDSDYEVIGNIHSNPELLGDNNEQG
jgi:uncharacterized phage protein (TIGR01671 family)